MKRIGASAIALAGSSGQALAFGPGHVERTADAGEPGVAVYAAHRDTHFRFLKDVAIGDEIDVTRHDGKTFRYRADSTAIVRFDQSGIDPFIAGHELVLTTCWPFDAMAHGPMRYVLHAAMISPPTPGTILAALITGSRSPAIGSVARLDLPDDRGQNSRRAKFRGAAEGGTVMKFVASAVGALVIGLLTTSTPAFPRRSIFRPGLARNSRRRRRTISASSWPGWMATIAMKTILR